MLRLVSELCGHRRDRTRRPSACEVAVNAVDLRRKHFRALNGDRLTRFDAYPPGFPKNAVALGWVTPTFTQARAVRYAERLVVVALRRISAAP